MDFKEEIISFEALYESMCKCRKGVMWKPSVCHYELNAIEETLLLEKKLKSGSYKPSRPRSIKIKYPKERDALSIGFKDRIYQRSINDNVLYPFMTKSFIYPNMACQTGKGTDATRELMKKYLKRHYHHYGLNGYVLQIDIKGYYDNMLHSVVNNQFKKNIPFEVYEMVENILETQYAGDTGYNPGSQMVQIAGISMLNQLDHFIKEKLHIKYYIRYMDDLILAHKDKEYLRYCLIEIQKELEKIGLKTHPKKTKIIKISEQIRFLGFDFRLTNTGKVIMLIDPDNVKHERKKLKKLVNKFPDKMSKDKIDACYKSWRNHASKGNSHFLLSKMDKYYESLWRDRDDFIKKECCTD